MTAYPPDTDDPIIDLPFPLFTFPPSIAAWLETTAAHARVPVTFVAFPFLAFTGAVLGNQVVLQVSPGWTERPTLWVSLVAPTGHGKTPALAAARKPFAAIHGIASNDEAEIDAIIDELDAKREARLALPEDQRPSVDESSPELEWDDSDVDVETDPPLFISSARIDPLTRVLATTCGLCLMRDELAGLIHTIDRGHTEDRQTLLSLWSSEPFYPSNLILPPIVDPVLAIVGGFHPRLLHDLRPAAHDGLLERFLVVYPEPAIIPQSEPEIAAPDPVAVETLVRSLRPIDHHEVTFSPDAAAAWRDWFHLNLAETRAAGPIVDGFYRKLPGQVARIALVLHALWHPKDLDTPLDESTIRYAIALGDTLRPFARRAAAALGERTQVSAAEILAQRIHAILTIEARWLTRTELQQRLGRPNLNRFNRVIASLIDNDAIEVSRETIQGSRKPVTLYRQPPQLGSNAGAG